MTYRRTDNAIQDTRHDSVRLANSRVVFNWPKPKIVWDYGHSLVCVIQLKSSSCGTRSAALYESIIMSLSWHLWVRERMERRMEPSFSTKDMSLSGLN